MYLPISSGGNRQQLWLSVIFSYGAFISFAPYGLTMGQGFLLYYYYYLVLELIVDLLTFFVPCKVVVLAAKDNEPQSLLLVA